MQGDDVVIRGVTEHASRSWDWHAHMHDVLALLPDVLYALDRDGTLLALSPPFASITGWSEAEWLGRPFAELLHPQDVALAHEQFLLGLHGKDTGPYRLRVRTKAGTYVAGEFRSKPLMVAGEVRGKIGVARDVTPVARVEATSRFLEEASQILASSLDYRTTLVNVARLAVPDVADWCAVDVIDERGQFQRLAVAHIDPSKESLAREIGQRYRAQRQSALLRQVVETGKSVLVAEITDEQLEAAARDAEHLALLRALGLHSAMLVPMVARGRTLGVITFILAETGDRYGPGDLALGDALASRAAVAVDNARLYQEAQDALRRRDEFLSIASHELRTPLTGISLQIGMLERVIRRLVLEPQEAERVQRALQLFNRQVRRLNLLVSELLDVSRLTAGRLELTRETIDLVELTREVAARFQEGDTAIPLTILAPQPVIGCWDRLSLDQILTNLLSNAVTYAPGSPVEIMVTQTGDQVELTLRDHGPGIPAERRSQIFDPFERGEHRTESGLGLGLYICRELAAAHGGSIALTPVDPHGVAFTVRLPLTPASP